MKLSHCGSGFILASLLTIAARGHAAVLRVTPQGNDALPGNSWSAAKQRVASALSVARSGDEIWVAAGVYHEHILAKDGVALYGGFQGDETTRDARRWLAQRTILDGTTNGVVVALKRCGPDTVVDGFTIQNGSGAGVYCLESSGRIQNNIIRGNTGNDALAYGGGISVWGSGAVGVLVIATNRVTDNASLDGGGIGCIDASPRIEWNVITWNLAYQNGGGISCWRNSSPVIANNTVTGNTASWLLEMPVPVGGGGIFATADDLDGRPHPTAVSAPLIVNNVVAANGGWLGGGIALVDSNGGIPNVINNTIVANNGSGLFWGSPAGPLVATKPLIRNNLVAYNAWGLEQAAGTPPNPAIEANCIYGNGVQTQAGDYRGLPAQSGANGNLSREPGLASYRFGNFHLQPNSPCIDAGLDPQELMESMDLDGQSRVHGKGIDIGADESNGSLFETSPAVFYVSAQGNDAADGRTWASARQSVQSAIDAAKLQGGEVWVGAGTYQEHIVLPAFVYLYGGFAGNETGRAQRNSALNSTILDGGGVLKVVQCGNAGYLVSALDGFTIRNGGKYTAGSGLSQYGVGGLGGGIYVGVASPYIANNLITHNSLAHDNRPSFPQPASYGAGIYCELSYAMIIGNTIRENEILNTFDGSGGGIYCTHSMPSIEQNRIASNHAKYGAAIYALDSSVRVRNNVIESNAMYNTYPLPLYLGSASGAIDLHDGSDFLIEANTIAGNTAAVGAGVSVSGFGSGRLQNNLILNNRAYEATGVGGMGGGIYCLVMTNAVDPVLILNNTLLGNSATSPFGEQGGALAFSLPPPADKLVIANNLIVSNSSGIFQTLTTPMSRATVLNNNLLNVRNDYINLPAGATDIRRAPIFCDSSAGNYRLQTNSPGIDAGTTRYAPSVDMDGLPRSLDGDGDGLALPDLGAFETILPTADSDHDGMPDGWEVENFLEPAVDDAALDRDGDGMCNVDEHVAGTGPSEGASVFKLTASVFEATGDFVLRWPSVVGRLYRIESASVLPAASGWQVVQENMVGTGGALEFHGAKPDSPTRLYRVEVQSALW